MWAKSRSHLWQKGFANAHFHLSVPTKLYCEWQNKLSGFHTINLQKKKQLLNRVMDIFIFVFIEKHRDF